MTVQKMKCSECVSNENVQLEWCRVENNSEQMRFRCQDRLVCGGEDEDEDDDEEEDEGEGGVNSVGTGGRGEEEERFAAAAAAAGVTFVADETEDFSVVD